MPTNGKEYKLAIRIAGVIDKSFGTSLATANTSLKATLASVDKDFVKLDKGFNEVMGVGTACFSALATAAGVATMAIGAATAASVAVGVEFESAFAGVKKTIEATEGEYEKLRKDVLEMSTTMPSSAVEIAGVMEVAGQLGIAKESLSDFTETMIELGVSTNLSAEEAATALARFTNITQMEDYGTDGISNFERLGSTVVDLGNKTATTEAEIVDMATNLAAAGNLALLSEADILAMAAAMSSVGVAAESGGSSMSRVLMQMQQAVSEGSADLFTYADTAGITAEEFAALFRDDAGEALTLFVEGLGEAGEDGYQILDDLNLSTIRVRKTLFSLSGAGDLFRRTMDIANTAWEENNALTIEAGKRYETVESRTQMLLNSLKVLGVTAYDELREPLVDGLGMAAESLAELTEYASGPDGISNWMDSIGDALPTLQRYYKKYGEPVFEGIVGAGEWIVNNGDGLIAMITGVGASLAAYKIVSTLSHIVRAFGTLAKMNPATWGILGVIGLIGGITAAYTAYKQHERELINENLAEHFGNITLSMEELENVAEHILDSDSLGGVKEALDAFGELDTIAVTMEQSVEDLNRMNWKVSIGMELSESEQGQYKEAILEYVAAAQEYALQHSYAVSLNLAAGMEDTPENADIAAKVNQFYQNSYSEMTELGQSLSDVVNEAFADNILDPKEMDAIAEIQRKMAEIQQSLAMGEFEAQLSVMKMEFTGGGDLSAETFQNLQTKLSEKASEAAEVYKDAYVKRYAEIQATMAGGGFSSDAEYQTALNEIEKTYLGNVTRDQLKALEFQFQTIAEQYGEEIGAFKEHLATVISEYASGENLVLWEENPTAAYTGMIQDIYNNDEVDVATRKALEELVKNLQPTVEQVESLKQRYTELGGELTEEMLTALSNVNLLEAMTVRDAVFGTNGSMNALEDFVDSLIVNEESLAGAKESVQKYGWMLPESFSEELSKATKETITPAVEGMYAWSQETIDIYFSQGFQTEADVSILLNGSLSGLSSWNVLSGINHRAEGGLATRPELTWFAENGPEMAIPIDGSRNAISLWEQTGRLLGMDSVLDGLSLEGGSGPAIEYSPTLQFYGEAPSKEDLTDALRISQDEFNSLMDRYFKTRGRVAFG